ncbi:putative membrane protein [Bacillus phage SP-15]|uniref:Putative membrane protein n=1 Tax=Bacillus phage SP-15 TaxID=1792032 RepID=A0A127AW18_9CAUD|nr:holin [Bacillus phage SP-15]AMM44869.1 putative membrane protein [Bacillus phage SP-15]
MIREILIAIGIAIVVVGAIIALIKIPSNRRKQLIGIGNAIVGAGDLLQLLGVPTGVINLIRTYAQEVVIAIEQTSKELSGTEKKELAMKELKVILSQLSKVEKLEGYDFSVLNDKILSVIIESCVFVMNTEYLKQAEKYIKK